MSYKRKGILLQLFCIRSAKLSVESCPSCSCRIEGQCAVFGLRHLQAPCARALCIIVEDMKLDNEEAASETYVALDAGTWDLT